MRFGIERSVEKGLQGASGVSEDDYSHEESVEREGDRIIRMV